MLVAHISEPGRLTYGHAPMAEHLAFCVEDTNKQLLQPDLVLLSGDVTNDFNLAQAEHAARSYWARWSRNFPISSVFCLAMSI
ncbi:MAG: hypothetical protein KUG74_01400 [Rhodobacteraceae bacterium]|nr:hypothetical protein [Paracoccaceae bacterium]